MKLKISICCVALLLSLTAFVSAGKGPVLAPSFAWRPLPPLGMHQEVPLDTLYENYSLRYVPQTITTARAATGNYCAEGYNMIFFNRAPLSDFFPAQSISDWIPSQQKAVFYNTRVPMTLLSYNFGGNKENAQDRLQGVFSGNINARAQLGAMLDYLYSKGMYNHQAAKSLNWGFSGSYIGDVYEIQGYFTHYNLLTMENGGITDDLYITDPAQVQGGNTSINYKQIPTNLNDAFNRVKGTEVYINQRYKMGIWQEEQINDTTTVRKLIPVTSIIWTLKYNDAVHKFRNFDASENLEFWDRTYLSPNYTDDFQKLRKLRNTLGVALLEGFNKYAQAGLAAYVTHEIRSYDMNSDVVDPTEAQAEAMTALPEKMPMMKQTENLLWVGAELARTKGKLLNYRAVGEIGLVGPAAGEVSVSGDIDLRIPLFGDSVPVHAYGKFTNLSAPWLTNHFYSNHFIWENNFSKTRQFRVGGDISIPISMTTLSAGVENLQNYIFFNQQACPEQYSGNLQVFSATLRQKLKFKALHWDNVITYQTSSNDNIIPLPRLAINSNLYLLFRIATLYCQFGVSCDYFTKYKAVNFQPATMAFYNDLNTMIGNYPFMNAYLNCKLKKVRFYVMMSHVNQGLTGTNYFSMPHYPMNPRRFQLGLSIDFAN